MPFALKAKEIKGSMFSTLLFIFCLRPDIREGLPKPKTEWLHFQGTVLRRLSVSEKRGASGTRGRCFPLAFPRPYVTGAKIIGR